MIYTEDAFKPESEAATIAAIEAALLDFEICNVVPHDEAMRQLRQTILDNAPALAVC
jgi:predicted transcriptional regulator